MDSEICTKKYYIFNEVLAGIDIVKKYIQDTRQVLVGGQSIDYALRLKGENLYEDWEIPDLDFQTDDYANVAYDIFKLVASALHERVDVGVLNAMHHTTMRVQVGKFCVADVTYVSKRILKMYRQSALTYDGCLIRHPYFQYIDMQRSFSYPYENTMREVVSNRWEKDYDRMLLTMKYYSPSDTALVKEFIGAYNTQSEIRLHILGNKKSKKKTKKVHRKNNPAQVLTLYKQLSRNKISKPILDIGIINGELAFMIYRDIYKRILGKKSTLNIKAKKYMGSDYFFNSYLMTDEDRDVFYTRNSKLRKIARYTNPYIDVIPARVICGDYEIIGVNQQTAYHTIDSRRVVTINYLVLYVSMMWITLGTDMYLSMYIKLLKMIERVYAMEDDNDLIRLMYPSIITYGYETPHPFEQHSLSFQKPENVYVNKYNPLSKALIQVTKYEYPAIYNMNGM